MGGWVDKHGNIENVTLKGYKQITRSHRLALLIVPPAYNPRPLRNHDRIAGLTNLNG